MILNLLQHKKHKLFSSNGFSGDDDTEFLLSTNISSKKVSNNSDHEYIIIESFNKSFLDEIILSTYGTFTNFTISYSLDNISWFLLPYKTNSKNELHRLLSTSGSGIDSSWNYLNLETNEVVIEYANDNPLTSYAFKYFNDVTRLNESLYSEFSFISLKIDIYGIDTSTTNFYFSNLEINVDDTLDKNVLKKNILELRGRDLYKGQLFEEQPFLQDITGTFFNMLGNSSIYDNKRNPIDIYRQLSNINKNLSIDNNKDNDFSFKKTIYYPERSRYELDPNETFVNNDLTYLNLQINQYAFEYKNLLEKVNTNILSDNALFDLKNNFTKFLLKNISKLNNLKGSLYLIDFILKSYAKFIGYYVVSVVEEKNFVYRITTSIPLDEWNGLLKNIVHPCGWNVIYNYVPPLGNLQIELGSLNENISFYNKLRSVLNSVSYFEGDYLNKFKNIKKLSSLRPGFRYEQFKHYKYNTKYGESNLNVNHCWEEKASVGLNYNNTFYEMIGKNNYHFFHDRISNYFDINFGKPGVAVHYIWKTFLGNKLVNTTITPFPNYKNQLNYLGDSRNFRTELTLKHRDWEQTVFGYKRNYDQYRALPNSFYQKNSRKSYLSILASNQNYEHNSGLALSNFTNESLNTSISILNDVSYINLPVSVGSSFVSEFDTLSVITSVITPIDSQYNILATYNKPGFATKYIWNIYNDDVLERTLITYFNYVNFNVNDYPNIKIELLLSNYDFNYKLYNNHWLYDLSYLLNGFNDNYTYTGGPTVVADADGILQTSPVNVLPIEDGVFDAGIWQPNPLWPATALKTKTQGSVTRYDMTNGGMLLEPVRTNYFLQSVSPATQNITTTAQVYTLSVIGSGSITLSGTGTGTATEGSPVTFTATAGTLTLTVAGALTHAQLEAGTYATSPITTTTAAVTRPAGNLVITPTHTGLLPAWIQSPHGYQHTHNLGGSVWNFIDTQLWSAGVAKTHEAIDAALAGLTEYTLMARTEKTSIFHRIDSPSGPYQITFVGGNGAIYQTTANNVTTDVAAQGLTAPVWVLVPAAVRSDAGLTYFYCYSNQFTGSIPDLSSNTALAYFSCAANQLTGSIPDLSSNTALTQFYCYINQLTGSIPDLSSNTALAYFFCYINQLTGSIPDLSSNTALAYFSCAANQLTGSIPDLSSNPALTVFYCYINQLTGSIPDLSSNTALTQFQCHNNQLTGIAVDFGVPNKTFIFNALNNQLTEVAINGILTAFDRDVTVSGGKIIINGAGNAAPTGAGLTAKTNMIAKGWTVSTN